MHKLLKRFEDLMVAITFAEASEYDEANRFLGQHDELHKEQGPLQDMENQTLIERAGR